MTITVAILDDYQGVAASLAPWEDSALDLELKVYREPVRDEDQLVERLGDCDAVVLMRERTPLPRRVVERLPGLRLVVTTGMRNSAIEPGPGVTVCGTESSSAPPAELTWALITALRRNLLAEDRAVREGRWQSTLGGDLEGAVLGLVGLGKIGARVATVGQSFGMRVLAWSQNLDSARAADLGVEAVPKDELLAGSDIVSLHLRLSERSRHVIGAAEIARMKPGALLVNTARSGLVDTEALLKALHEGGLGGAGLDVFDTEPLPAGDPLLNAPNTVLAPHLGYVTRGNYRTYFTQALEDVEAFFTGAPVRVIEEGTRA
ncbi:D-2-hydroxyacid dehydrogenase family protein [Nocardiopsis metallicus]|uniref:Phosphoglycerate dehydrogenase-like enzyme n=1 Tax=Nocardiopsis metallicus TaxID=179819 RepID=A0A840WW10_9ACTN|nr:D-2-hydroxyacid dehydrogenase family protein [Nocardiopsis metallicus]MBB5494338.1 phosphoglycerate dehydrogenase-like enzyme [Nocardiopsis metallicus]